MKFERKLSIASKPVEDQVQWKTVPAHIEDAKGNVIFHMDSVEVPAYWSQTAVNILAQKYFRKVGVPLPSNRLPRNRDEENIPEWLRSCLDGTVNDERGGETSAKQVFHRLAGAWTYHGWKMALFDNEKEAKAFYDELYLILAQQLAAPNSPQWFNTGLWWAYRIGGSANGQWAINYDIKKGMVGVPFETKNAYEYPQPHACFIQPISDDLVNPGGILDLVVREGRLFKQGSGTGTNFSNIRAKDELLSGGGKSSGLMSFLEIGDRAAGAIKSGGTTRRAAKMVIVDADHPEIEDFIWWKAREEQKAAAMWIGSKLLREQNLYLYDNYLLPDAMHDRIDAKLEMEEFGIGYEGEAIRTVGGQNANNSVRVTDFFMRNVERNELHQLHDRNGGRMRSIYAQDLWNQICRAAWASADPGLQFHDTINKWHTCKTDGEIRGSNPCSEYMFLDNTACNLASLNLGKFYKPKNLQSPECEFDIDLFCHVARLMTVVLDISVSMASFPSREIALGSYNYRTLGLGYANLGALLMRMGLGYDTNGGRRIAATITALLHGISYKTSGELAQELGPFPRFEINKESMLNVIQQHVKALYEGDFANGQLESDGSMESKVFKIWAEIVKIEKFRNAQTTLLAPTGTIALLMDCDTTGIEPDFSLVKSKSLAGGGEMTIVNGSVGEALFKLGYKTHTINLIEAYVRKNRTVEGCLDLLPEHLSVFDCAVAPQGFSRALEPMAHVKMVAAVQPFLSGAVSKTVNMPNSATIEDVSEVYMQAWKLDLKAVAIYRDGSKLAQPLNSGKTKATEDTSIKDHTTIFNEANLIPENVWRTFVPNNNGKEKLLRGIREHPPWRRTNVFTQKVKIGPEGQSVHLTIAKYPDGRPAEVRLDWSRIGTTLEAMTNLVAMMISIGLQYGVPVEEFVDKLQDRKFEPSGMVEGHEAIKWVSSIADLIAREFGITFLGREEMGQVQSKGNGDKIIAGLKEAVAYAKGENTDVRITEYPREIRAIRDICPKCHEPCLIRTGTCQKCSNCDYDEGCG